MLALPGVVWSWRVLVLWSVLGGPESFDVGSGHGIERLGMRTALVWL